MVKYFFAGLAVVVGTIAVSYVLGLLAGMAGLSCKFYEAYPGSCFPRRGPDNEWPSLLMDGFAVLAILMMVWLACTTVGILTLHWRSISPEQLGKLLEKIAPKS